MTKKAKIFWVLFSFSILLIISIILISLSVSITEIDEMSLTLTRGGQELNYDLDYAQPGRHFTGLFKKLITFKRNHILVNFADEANTPNSTTISNEIAAGGNSLACWTKDGTNVYLDVSYYFTLVPEKLLDFYKDYGDKWLDFIVRFSYSAIKETTVEYTTNQFVT